jgi:hypothetical protein
MEDVLGVYGRPYDPKRPVICLDECSKALRGTPRGSIAPKPGRPERRDHEYERNGTRNIFVALEPLTGKRLARVTKRRCAIDFADQLRILVDEIYAEAERLVLVCDNLNTHHPASLYERFVPEEASRIAAKIEWHYTPEHASWLNMAEIEISILTRQCLSRRIPDQLTLEREVAAWQKTRDDARASIDWQFTTADARIKLKRLYPVIQCQLN